VAGPEPAPTCALSPASVVLGNKAVSSMLTITAPAAGALLVPEVSTRLIRSINRALLSLAAIVLTLLAGSKKRSRRYVWLCSFFLLVLIQAACAGGGSAIPDPPKNYTVTVFGASPTIVAPVVQHSTQIAVSIP
jgi:hypothetical protein